MTTPWIILAYVTWMLFFVSFWAWLKMKDDKADVLRRSASVDTFGPRSDDNK